MIVYPGGVQMAQTSSITSRRDRQREDTRRDLAIAALDLACQQGLANVRVPEIAAAAGVSTRTFNNYFASKEAAIVWPAMTGAGRVADNLLARPAEERLDEALVAAVGDLYQAREGELASDWVRKLRALAAREPALRGEYLKAADAREQALAAAIAVRIGSGALELRPRVMAAVVAGAERAAVRHWMENGDKRQTLRTVVRQALRLALSG